MYSSISGDFRKPTSGKIVLTSSQSRFLGLLHKTRPVIYKELLNPNNKIIKDHFFKLATKLDLCRWEDTDDYVKRLFANLALYDYEEPRSMTFRFNKNIVGGLTDPLLRKKNVNYICDQLTRKMRALDEVPRFWFVIEPVPTPHMHGGIVLTHTKPKDFMALIKSLRAKPNNSFEMPLQSNATEKYGVDSRHQWVIYTAKSARTDGFDFSISQQLTREARVLYETLRGNQKISRQRP